MTDGADEVVRYFGEEAAPLPKDDRLTEELLAEYLQKNLELTVLESQVKTLKRRIEALAPPSDGKQQKVTLGKYQLIFKRRVFMESLIGPTWRPDV